MKIEVFGRVLWDFNAALADKLPAFMLFDGKLYMPWQMILYLAAGFIAAIAVSVFTKPESKEKLDKFYECIRTPVAPGEPETELFTLPEGTEPAPRNVLIDHPDFEVPKPTFVGIVGFVAGRAFVAVVIVWRDFFMEKPGYEKLRRQKGFDWYIGIGGDSLWKLAGIPIQDFYLNPAACIEAYKKGRPLLRELFGPDVPEPVVSTPMIKYGHLNTPGAEVKFPEGGEPHHSFLFDSPDEPVKWGLQWEGPVR